VVVSFKLNYAISAKDFVILAKFLLTEKIFISQRRKGFYPRITLINTNYIKTFYYNYKKLEKIREIRGQNLFFVCSLGPRYE